MNRSQQVLEAVANRLKSMEYTPKPIALEEPTKLSSPRTWTEWASDADPQDLERRFGGDGHVYVIYCYCLLLPNIALKGRPSRVTGVGAAENQAGNLLWELPETFNSHQGDWVMRLSEAELDREFAMDSDIDDGPLGFAVVARIEARYHG